VHQPCGRFASIDSTSPRWTAENRPFVTGHGIGNRNARHDQSVAAGLEFSDHSHSTLGTWERKLERRPEEAFEAQVDQSTVIGIESLVHRLR